MPPRLWYNRPAREWLDALPVGNGTLGAMMFGDARRDRIALNHEWLWRAANRFRDDEPVALRLPEIREMFFAGKTLEAGDLAAEVLSGPRGRRQRVDPYQPAGDLILDVGHKYVQAYRRELDLAQAVCTVEYRFLGVMFRRATFAHSRLPLLVTRLSASEPGALDFSFGLSRASDPECSLAPWSGEHAARLLGRFVEGARFGIETRLFSHGGTEAKEGFALVKAGPCSEALLLTSIAVCHDGKDPEALLARQLDVPPDWASLLESHSKEHSRLFGRTTLDLGGNGDDRPTDERIAAMRENRDDPGLLNLYFDYGRYLLISSSRPGGLPANLQGIWNEDVRPPWDSDFHHNINLQMNYWPAEVCGLAECAEPLFDHVERFLPHGRQMARAYFNCEGVCLPLQTDPWGRATAESYSCAVWTGAAAWLAQHFWWRYEFGLDRDFLRERAYHLLKEVAAFYESYLVPDPQGRLVPVPSQSPENTFVGGSKPVSLCIGAAMDLELIRDSLTHAIQAAEILNVDEAKRKRWRGILAKLAPLQIGKHGQLMEWMEDYEECDPGHRHVSHLFALFPGDQITLDETPDLAKAARVSLERRLSSGGGYTGWSRAWTIGLWARLREGDKALEHLIDLLANHTTSALLDLHPPGVFQIDGNLGGPAVLAEMLLQSHAGVVRVLPALPKAWREGSAKGLRARGGFAVDIEWESGLPQKVRVKSLLGQPLLLDAGRAGGNWLCEGEPLEAKRDASGRLAIETAKGSCYTLEWPE